MLNRLTTLSRFFFTPAPIYAQRITPVPLRFFAKQKGKKPKETESEAVEVNFDLDSIKQEMTSSLEKLE